MYINFICSSQERAVHALVFRLMYVVRKSVFTSFASHNNNDVVRQSIYCSKTSHNIKYSTFDMSLRCGTPRDGMHTKTFI